MSARSIALSLVLAAAPLAAVTSLAQTAPAPPHPSVLEPEASNLDLGTVAAGDPAVATFVLHNPSDRVVKIVRAKPS